jgi:hypothetical protein
MLFALSLSLVAFTARSAQACTCVGFADGSGCRSAASAAAIFEGTVARIERVSSLTAPMPIGAASASTMGGGLLRVTFTAVDPLRGALADTVVTAADGSACGYEFAIGKRYLVVADGDRTSQLSVN